MCVQSLRLCLQKFTYINPSHYHLLNTSLCILTRRPDTPRILFLKFLRGKNVVYEYNVHIYISHFFFIRDKVECHYTLLSHFYVVLVCRRAEWHFTVQIMVWSHCKNKTTVGNPGTIGLSLINNWSVGLIKGICIMCVLRCSGYLFEGC